MKKLTGDKYIKMEDNSMKKDIKRVTNPDELPMILTPSDIAAILGISRNQAYQYIHSKGFPYFKVGEKLYRIKKDKFLEWLDSESAA